MFAMIEGVSLCNPLINIDGKVILEESVVPNYFLSPWSHRREMSTSSREQTRVIILTAMKSISLSSLNVLLLSAALSAAHAQTAERALPGLPAPLAIPKPGAAGEGPYAPQAILPGGVVVPLYPPGSPLLKADRVREPEQYNMSQTVPGRIASIVNIHNPSIEFHPVDKPLNTGAVVILVAGGGHNTLNVGTESADFAPFFYNYGVLSVRLRSAMAVAYFTGK
jgi:hypothetical protein